MALTTLNGAKGTFSSMALKGLNALKARMTLNADVVDDDDDDDDDDDNDDNDDDDPGGGG